jgi:hypothetical protein
MGPSETVQEIRQRERERAEGGREREKRKD